MYGTLNPEENYDGEKTHKIKFQWDIHETCFNMSG